MNYKQHFSRKLKEYRKENNLTQDDLAEILGYSNKNIAKWEDAYGEKATPKAETMHEKIQRYKEMADKQNASQPYRSRGKGAR